MKTIKASELNYKNEEFKNFVLFALENKMRIFINDKIDKRISYAHVQEGENLGYFQCGDFGHGVRISTVHKSVNGSGHGTGFGITDHMKSEETPTLEILRSSFIFAPHWAKGDLSKITKYKGFEDYKSRPINQILNNIEVVL